MAIKLEVCVDDTLGLAEAIAGGTDRIELCAALSIGGLTPSYGLMTVAARCGVPCYPMIRPRAGDFVFTTAEVEGMRADIRAARNLGLPGVVLGASLADGSLDEAVLQLLLTEAAGLDVTLHRAIDLAPDKLAAVDTAIGLGFRRILTSGGALTASDGVDQLHAMMERAGDRCIIMPGSGISVSTLVKLCHLPLREVHASCAAPLPVGGAPLRFGFQAVGEKRTDRALVAALKAALQS